MKKQKNNFNLRLSNILTSVSLFFLIIPTIILWIFVGVTKIIMGITVLVSLLILMDISTLIINKFYKKKINESIPLMKHRMNKFLTQAIFFFSIGLPLFIASWLNGGFIENIIQTAISIIFILVGGLFYEIGYIRRDNFIERTLIKDNKRNTK